MPDQHGEPPSNVRVLHRGPLGNGKTLNVSVEETAPAARDHGSAERSRRPKTARVTESDQVHRSLYARPETIETIRQIAFREGTTAQALYREGLFLTLRRRGYYRDKTLDDV